MSIDWLWKHLEGSESSSALTAMLRSHQRPVTFVVGSALSAPDLGVPGSRGVPDVSGMIERIKQVFAGHAEASAELERKLLAVPDQAYSTAMRFLLDWSGRDAVRVLVRDAVLEARKQPQPDREWTEQELKRIDERDPDGWVLPPGARGLGTLLVKQAGKYPGPVITTNFDPLVSVAIQRVGGQPHHTVLANDGRVPGGGYDSSIPLHVVHLHGYWRGGATLHTPAQLIAPRPMLRQSLQSMLHERTVVVVGYGGWNDAFIGTLRAMLFDEQIEIVWCCYERQIDQLIRRYRALFESMQELIQRSQFRIYLGIDCRTIFDLLLDGAPIATAVPVTPSLHPGAPVPGVAPAPVAEPAANGAPARRGGGDDTVGISSDPADLLPSRVKDLRDTVLVFDEFLAAATRVEDGSSWRLAGPRTSTAVLLLLGKLGKRLDKLMLIWGDGRDALWVTEIRTNAAQAQGHLRRFKQRAEDPYNDASPMELRRSIERLRELIVTRYPSACDIEELSARAEAAMTVMNRTRDDPRGGGVTATRLKDKVETNAYDVFLCHNSKDKPQVIAIGERLKERGIRPWLDVWEIRPGRRWQKELQRNIKTVKSAAVFIGARGPGPWQELEVESFLQQFVNRNRPIIPVILEGRSGNPRLPAFLRSWQMVDMRRADPDPFEQLVWGITGERPTEA